MHLLDLVGTAVFAITGALSAGRKRMDIFGVVVLGCVTALGGGTLRDMILGSLSDLLDFKHGIFWGSRHCGLRYISIGTVLETADDGPDLCRCGRPGRFHGHRISERTAGNPRLQPWDRHGGHYRRGRRHYPGSPFRGDPFDPSPGNLRLSQSLRRPSAGDSVPSWVAKPFYCFRGRFSHIGLSAGRPALELGSTAPLAQGRSRVCDR